VPRAAEAIAEAVAQVDNLKVDTENYHEPQVKKDGKLLANM